MTWRWLESTNRLQRESFGFIPEEVTSDQLADYFTTNCWALVAELAEFSQEVGWKPWASPRGWVEKERALNELVDVGHFLANLLNALGITDDQWEAAYRLKQQLNRKRQEDGYDGRSTKCRGCSRALDQEITRPSVNGEWLCRTCARDWEHDQEYGQK